MSNDDLVTGGVHDEELEEGADLDAAILDDDMLPEEEIADPEDEPFVAPVDDEEEEDAIIEDSYDDVNEF